jgi:hypothetical protein
MSRSRSARFARNLAPWLIVLLCSAMLAWRIDTRIEQYHPSGIGTRAAVAVFDANERNTATLAETHFKVHARLVAEHPVDHAEVDGIAALALRLMEAGRRRPESPPVLLGSDVQPVSLFPKPPPPLHD